jgi:hypothetical protein
MKIALLLSLIVVLTGCPAPRQNGDNKHGMDSPIIISDGSTRLRHKGSNADFQIANNSGVDQVIVYDQGYMVNTVDCIGVTTCPSAFTNPLVAPWTMDVFDANSVKIMTISSADNMTVTINFYAHYIDPEPDVSGDTTGTDIIQHDYKFKSASFTNGGAQSVPINCSSSPCKLKIHYKN